MFLPKVYPVTSHSSHVGEGSTFVAVDGFVRNGAGFISLAIEKGASKIVLSRSSKKGLSYLENKDVLFEYVDDTRKALAELSSLELGNPSSKLKIIGITGTKGKTTTAFLVEHILRRSGFKTALLGSIKNKILSEEVLSEEVSAEEVSAEQVSAKQVSSALTTPGSDYLHMFFNECVKKGVEYVVMEVSSHAIALSRVHGLSFEIVGFTNLASEHMDFHSSLDDYFSTKMRLFSQLKEGGCAVVNSDDEWGKKAIESLENKEVRRVTKKDFELRANDLNGLKILFLKRNLRVSVATLFGLYNAYNIAMAIEMVSILNVGDDQIVDSLRCFSGVPGRLQLFVLKSGAKAFVDFAHNPSSFESVLKTLRSLTDDLIVVFGCGGDRDRTKRPEMGRLASVYADKIIITDDNPRSEDRKKIEQEIYGGIREEMLLFTTSISDRSLAIKKAVAFAQKNSIIALLGKGHESYSLRDGERYYFNDFEEISKY